MTDTPTPASADVIEGMREALERRPAYWTFDAKADAEHGIRAYYFAPMNRAEPPYLEQREVTAILDIAADGTLAGVELVIGDLPPPPMGETHLQDVREKLAQLLLLASVKCSPWLAGPVQWHELNVHSQALYLTQADFVLSAFPALALPDSPTTHKGE